MDRPCDAVSRRSLVLSISFSRSFFPKMCHGFGRLIDFGIGRFGRWNENAALSPAPSTFGAARESMLGLGCASNLSSQGATEARVAGAGAGLGAGAFGVAGGDRLGGGVRAGGGA